MQYYQVKYFFHSAGLLSVNIQVSKVDTHYEELWYFFLLNLFPTTELEKKLYT